MVGYPFRDTFAAKGSDLYKAITEGKSKAQCDLVYNETTKRMKALIPSKLVVK